MKYLILSIAFFAVLGQIHTETLEERVDRLEDGALHVAEDHICAFPLAARVLKKAMIAYQELADEGSEEFEAFEAVKNATESLKSFLSVLKAFCEPEGPASRELDMEVNEVRGILERFLEADVRRGGRTGRPSHRRTTLAPSP